MGPLAREMLLKPTEYLPWAHAAAQSVARTLSTANRPLLPPSDHSLAQTKRLAEGTYTKHSRSDYVRTGHPKPISHTNRVPAGRYFYGDPCASSTGSPVLRFKPYLSPHNDIDAPSSHRYTLE